MKDKEEEHILKILLVLNFLGLHSMKCRLLNFDDNFLIGLSYLSLVKSKYFKNTLIHTHTHTHTHTHIYIYIYIYIVKLK